MPIDQRGVVQKGEFKGPHVGASPQGPDPQGPSRPFLWPSDGECACSVVFVQPRFLGDFPDECEPKRCVPSSSVLLWQCGHVTGAAGAFPCTGTLPILLAA